MTKKCVHVLIRKGKVCNEEAGEASATSRRTSHQNCVNPFTLTCEAFTAHTRFVSKGCLVTTTASHEEIN